jgi:hypothetical protein
VFARRCLRADSPLDSRATMNSEPRFRSRFFLRSVLGALAGSALDYVVRLKTAVLSSLETVVVPVIAFGGVTLVAYAMARGTK